MKKTIDKSASICEINEIALIDAQIEKAYKTVRELENKKAKYQRGVVFKNFKKNCYYCASYNCESIYFIYNEDNVKVQEMSGTVGYTGENDVLIKSGFWERLTRVHYDAGVFHNKYLHLSEFSKYQVQEIDLNEFNEQGNNIIKSVQKELEANS